jgi:hypothetical protein
VPVATKEPTATPQPTAAIAPAATKAANDSEHVVVYEYLLSHYKIKDDDGKESDFYPDLTLSFTTISVYRYGDKTKLLFDLEEGEVGASILGPYRFPDDHVFDGEKVKYFSGINGDGYLTVSGDSAFVVTYFDGYTCTEYFNLVETREYDEH